MTSTLYSPVVSLCVISENMLRLLLVRSCSFGPVREKSISISEEYTAVDVSMAEQVSSTVWPL